jgi:amino acid permease
MHAPISKIEHSGTRSKGHLLRILGVGFGVAVIVGNTIGSGILLTSGEVAAHLRNPWLIFAAWSAGGVFAFFCTQSVAELGTMLPQAGGWFVYARRAFGEYGGSSPGAAIGWCNRRPSPIWRLHSASLPPISHRYCGDIQRRRLLPV